MSVLKPQANDSPPVSAISIEFLDEPIASICRGIASDPVLRISYSMKVIGSHRGVYIIGNGKPFPYVVAGGVYDLFEKNGIRDVKFRAADRSKLNWQEAIKVNGFGGLVSVDVEYYLDSLERRALLDRSALNSLDRIQKGEEREIENLCSLWLERAERRKECNSMCIFGRNNEDAGISYALAERVNRLASQRRINNRVFSGDESCTSNGQGIFYVYWPLYLRTESI